ncbi:MAG: response regulator transcription factor [Bacteroidota bacterium]
MKLLLAEDNDIFRKSLLYFLSNNGYNVTGVDNGLDAIELLRKEPFDLIITDVNMPFAGGMELINLVRTELKSQIPIIVLTSSNVEQTELEAFDLGASEFVTKPFSPLVLVARIEKLAKQMKLQ